MTTAIFNTLEAGLQITDLGDGDAVRLSQIGLEYARPGPSALPSDFPSGFAYSQAAVIG